MTSPSPPSVPPWWGEFQLPLHSAQCWQVGSFRLHLMRTHHELAVTWWRGSEPDEPMARAAVAPSEIVPASATLERFAFRTTPERVRILPAAPDRPVVAMPIHPFHLPPREEAMLYVSLPLWLQLQTDDGVLLFEEPLYRPSDTWFGPDTRVGQLCYGSRTTARTNLANLPVAPHRAVSTVRIRNLASSVLELEKLSMPTPNLSIHAGSNNHLWTESVLLEREADGDFAAMELESGPPEAAGDTRLVQQARIAPGRKTPLLAFGRLLRRGGLHG